MDERAARCTLHAVVVLCFGCWQGLANRSMRIQYLYVGPFPIPRFISLFFQVLRMRTRTRIPAHSHAHTHAHWQLVKADIAFYVVVPADCVHVVMKCLEMRTIPDNPGYTW